MTVHELDQRIEELKAEKSTLKGTNTEVYSRIVGYYRSLNNWNKGKREEYNYRSYYNSDYAALDNTQDSGKPLQGEFSLEETPDHDRVQKYLFFFRQTCPNCPPMKEILKDSPYKGDFIDVDTEEGYRMAEKYTIMAAPTVVFVDAENNEIDRATRPSDILKKDKSVMLV